MEELEKLEYPKPLREFVYETFNEFAREHPWVRGDDVRPKSIAREMFERFMDFNEYVREYELGRAEGTLLRYLSDAYKALVQTVPGAGEDARGRGDRGVPARDGPRGRLEPARRVGADALARSGDGARAPRRARGARRGGHHARRAGLHGARANAMFQLLRALARRDWAAAAALVSAGGNDAAWTAELFEQALKPFFEDHTAIRLDPSARAPANTRVTKAPAGGTWPTWPTWDVIQVVPDAEGDDDWAISCWIDLESSARTAKPVMVMRGIAG